MTPNKLWLYGDYLQNRMYNDIFRDKYDTYEDRYKCCYKEYMNGIKYNRSKRNTSMHQINMF